MVRKCRYCSRWVAAEYRSCFSQQLQPRFDECRSWHANNYALSEWNALYADPKQKISIQRSRSRPVKHLKLACIFSYLLCSCSASEWPRSGQEEVADRVSGGPNGIHCEPSKWMRANGYVYRPELDDSNSCQFHLSQTRWVSNDEVVNGILRCEVGRWVGEYSVQAFRNDDHAMGGYQCNFAFVKTTDAPTIGSITDIILNPY